MSGVIEALAAIDLWSTILGHVELINNNNGWLIAFLGISIVFSVLTLLSLTISQLHKVLIFLDNPKENVGKFFASTKTTPPKEIIPINTMVSAEILESSKQLKLLSKIFTEPFSLPKLLNMADERDIYRPYFTVSQLLLKGVLCSTKDGLFYWNQEVQY